MVKKPLTYTLHIIYFLLLIYWFCRDVKRSYMHCVKYAKTRTFYDAYFPVFDAALIRLRKYCYHSVYVRENTATILSIYGKTDFMIVKFSQRYYLLKLPYFLYFIFADIKSLQKQTRDDVLAVNKNFAKRKWKNLIRI